MNLWSSLVSQLLNPSVLSIAAATVLGFSLLALVMDARMRVRSK
jgi:hypothetical protein